MHKLLLREGFDMRRSVLEGFLSPGLVISSTFPCGRKIKNWGLACHVVFAQSKMESSGVVWSNTAILFGIRFPGSFFRNAARYSRCRLRLPYRTESDSSEGAHFMDISNLPYRGVQALESSDTWVAIRKTKDRS